jgi:CRP-like cAMP-binding protein
MSFVSDFKQTPLFNACDDKVLHLIADGATALSLSPGQGLFVEGDAADRLYIVKSGTLVLKKSTSKGEEDLIKIGARSVLGEMALVSVAGSGQYEKRSTSAEAIEGTQLIEIPFAHLEKVLSSHAETGLQFYKNLAINLSGRIRNTVQELASVRSLRLRHD